MKTLTTNTLSDKGKDSNKQCIQKDKRGNNN